MREFDGLPIFAKVVELGSFSEAARLLNLPTTTVSRKIQLLEAELGGKLLNRTTRSLSLTELGERVLPKALLIQDTLKELQSEAEAFSTEPLGQLHLSAPRAFCQNILAPLLVKFRQKYPGIKIELDASNRIQDLTKSRTDFAFRIGELADSSLLAVPLSKVHYELVASSDWVTNNSELTHPTQLNTVSTIRNHVEGYILPWYFNKDGESHLHQMEPDLLSDDLTVSLAYARNGLGVAYLPVSLTKSLLESKELVALLPTWQKQTLTAYLVYTNRNYLPQKSKLFIEFIKENKGYFKNHLEWN
ncbi:LysR family transcriptional regulator [Shewanella zhangzhouensis]|uniref:LysR family transcriptional regulator n=1 Tax=Shewanella zhangzhouensis TaxID=2864213 RepID=UPI001C65DED8|nr:LysR family transcriptional regulator [Shewanella zhangzhouensis]QYK07012.1 LysR family transcriptional regulator [Shewanella zhangzhouensis]